MFKDENGSLNFQVVLEIHSLTLEKLYTFNTF